MAKWFAVFVVVLATTVCSATAQERAAPESQIKLTIDDVVSLLDKHRSADARDAALHKAQSLAEKKDRDALYLLGVLYAWGREHPAALIDVDLVRAERYLSNAAVKGISDAIPALADVEIALGKADAAAAWSLVYLHADNQRIEQRKQSGAKSLMQSDFAVQLYRRCVAAVGSTYDENAAMGDASALVDRYPAILAAHSRTNDLLTSLNPGGLAPSMSQKQGKPQMPSNSGPQPDFAWKRTAVVLVKEDGGVADVLLLDASPRKVAQLLPPRYDLLRYATAADGTGLRLDVVRWTMQPND